MHLHAEVRILHSILSHTGNQYSAIKQSLELSDFVFPGITLEAIFWTLYNFFILDSGNP